MAESGERLMSGGEGDAQSHVGGRGFEETQQIRTPSERMGIGDSSPELWLIKEERAVLVLNGWRSADWIPDIESHLTGGVDTTGDRRPRQSGGVVVWRSSGVLPTQVQAV